MNDKYLDDLFDEIYEENIKSNLEMNNVDSVLDVKIRYKQVKSKFFIFPYKKEVRYIEFTVDEPAFIIEMLTKDLKLEDFVVNLEFDYEIIYI